MTYFSRSIIAVIALLMTFGAAQAALIDRGGGFIYDDVLDITWTQDADINGLGDWYRQMGRAAGLSIVDTRPGAGGVTYSDWRLPSMNVNGDYTIVNCSVATELACRDNEYGYLFHQYGVTAATPGLFTNVQSGLYWSGTHLAPNPANAWNFNFNNGNQNANNKNNNNFAWAVRPGE